MKPQKIEQIKAYVGKHPGCTSHEIIKALGESYGQLVYYAASKGLIKAVKDKRLKRSYVYFP